MADTDKPRPNRLLRNARLEQGLTEAALAEAIGAAKVTVSRWENDVSKKPSPHYHKKLLDALKKQTTQELGFDPEDIEQEPQQFSQLDDATSTEHSMGC